MVPYFTLSHTKPARLIKKETVLSSKMTQISSWCIAFHRRPKARESLQLFLVFSSPLLPPDSSSLPVAWPQTMAFFSLALGTFETPHSPFYQKPWTQGGFPFFPGHFFPRCNLSPPPLATDGPPLRTMTERLTPCVWFPLSSFLLHIRSVADLLAIGFGYKNCYHPFLFGFSSSRLLMKNDSLFLKATSSP